MTAGGARLQPERATTDGFYADQFSLEELTLIAAFVQDPTVDDEIWMQRVVNRRLLQFMHSRPAGEASDNAGPAAETSEGGAEDDEDSAPNLEQERRDLAAITRVAEALARGTGRVARLLRDKRALSGKAADGIAGAIAAALDELTSELGIEL